MHRVVVADTELDESGTIVEITVGVLVGLVEGAGLVAADAIGGVAVALGDGARGGDQDAD